MKIDTFRPLKVLQLGKHLFATTAARGVTIGLCGVLSSMWCALAGSRNGNVESLMSFIAIVFVILGAVCGFFSVPALFQHNRWTTLLKLPCSPLERLVAVLLNGHLSYTVIFITPVAVAFGVGWLLNLCFWGYSHAVFDPFSQNLCAAYLGGLLAVSIGTLVALYRKPHQQVLWFTLLFLSMVFLPVYVMSLFRGSPIEPLMGTLGFREELANALCINTTSRFMSAFFTLMWFIGIPLAAYFRLRESEA